MNFTNKTPTRLVLKQIPILLYIIGAIFSLPMLIFGLYNTIKQTGADGSIFGIIWGVTIIWIVLEFIATRQEIIIDKEKDLFLHIVKGLFRTKKQLIPLKTITSISLETKQIGVTRGRRYKHVYACDNKEKHLINNPSILYIDHSKTAKILSDFLSIPLETYIEELKFDF